MPGTLKIKTQAKSRMRIILFMADLHLDRHPLGTPFVSIGIWAVMNPIIDNIDEIVNCIFRM